ncbi:MAG: ribonuclease HI [Rickettsiaceae bacterium]|nr:ribonuclease HI [Rickettsiaceae bacterium]
MDAKKLNNKQSYIEIYTDGACASNPGPGGWGVLLICGNKKKEIFGYSLATTNNQMELQAAIEALKILKKTCKIKLYTDSQYVKKGITEWVHNWQKNNWRKSDNKPIKNADLWQSLLELTMKHEVKWHWVKAHDTNAGNIIADSLAVKGRDIAKSKQKE